MLSDNSFLQTILAHPDDDGPRLVYADWLEERGECDRAELIRLQCLGGPDERIRELLSRHGRRWAGPVARHAYGYSFKRGFVGEFAIEASVLLQHAEEIFHGIPVALVRVIGARSAMRQLFELPLLARVRALHLTGCNVGDEGAVRLSACPYLAGLHTLRVGCNAIGDRGVEYLADSPQLVGLQSLVLHGNLIGDAGAHALATADGLINLYALDLSENHIGETGAGALAKSARHPRLVRLDLSHQFKGWSAGLAQRGRPYPIQPTQQRALKERYGSGACEF